MIINDQEVNDVYINPFRFLSSLLGHAVPILRQQQLAEAELPTVHELHQAVDGGTTTGHERQIAPPLACAAPQLPSLSATQEQRQPAGLHREAAGIQGHGAGVSRSQPIC